MEDQRTFVIVGAGHVGATAAQALRDQGFAGRVVLIEDEDPDERPARSQAFTRPEHWPATHDVELRRRTRVTKIDPVDHHVSCDTGERIPYDKLLLATGARDGRGTGVELTDGTHVEADPDIYAAGDVAIAAQAMIDADEVARSGRPVDPAPLADTTTPLAHPVTNPGGESDDGSVGVDTRKDKEAFADAMADIETLAANAFGGVEGLDRASCSPNVKHLAEIGIGAAARGCSREGWRTEVGIVMGADADAVLDEAEDCMRTSGLWPWSRT